MRSFSKSFSRDQVPKKIYEEDEEVVYSVCPQDCYCTCSMRIHLKDGKVVKVDGLAESPYTEGSLCLKGNAYIQHTFNPQRIKYPMLRQEDGSFKRISWGEAINIIGEKLTYIKDHFGPSAMVWWPGADPFGMHSSWGTRFFNLYGSVNLISPGDSLCFLAGVRAFEYIYGIGNPFHDPTDWVNSKLLVIWGTNKAVTTPRSMKYILDARDNGGKLIVVDPRFTRTAAKADWWINPRQGTDGALVLGMLHIILERGLENNEFLNHHTIGWEKFVPRIKEFPPERVSKITGLSLDTLEKFAVEYSTVKPASIFTAMGITHYSNGFETARLLAVLPAATGNLGIPGGGLNYQAGDGWALNYDAIEHPENLPKGAKRIINSVAELPEVILSGKMPIKGMVICGGNPLTSWPNSSKVKRALERLEFLLYIGFYMDDSAKVSHLFLPAATALERNDIVRSFGHYYLHWQQKAIEPLGESKTEFEIWSLLAQEMGHTKWFNYTEEELLRRVLDCDLARHITLESLKKTPGGIRLNMPLVYPRVEDLKTPSGKVEIYCERLKEDNYDPLPFYEEPVESPFRTPEVWKEYPLMLMTGHLMPDLHSSFNLLPWMRELNREAVVDINPKTARELGIQKGELVYVESRRGRIRLRARITNEVSPQMVFVAEGWPLVEEKSVNALVDDSSENLTFSSGTPGFNNALVKIYK
jgi:anaerobic selenocysteine-containing dehydrogenase